MSKRKFNISITMTKTESDNDFIQECIDTVLREAVVFFSTPRFRVKKEEELERYFYHKEEVDKVLSMVPHPEILEVKEVPNEDGTIFCWCIKLLTNSKKVSK